MCRAVNLSLAQLTPADDTLQELLDELEVYCAHRAQGCSWKGPRSSFQEHVERTCEKIAERERQKRELEKLCREINPLTADVVKLSVGGVSMETSSTTLCTKEPNSVLAALFREPNKLQRNSAGDVVLDLDPDAFELVLLVPRGLSAERADRLYALATKLRLNALASAVRTPSEGNESPLLTVMVRVGYQMDCEQESAELQRRLEVAHTLLKSGHQLFGTDVVPSSHSFRVLYHFVKK